MPPMPAEAEAPPDLVTPLTASPARSARCARAARGIGEAGERIFGRRLCHGDRAFGERCHVGLHVVGRYHRLAAADERAQPHTVDFGALGILDRALAHLDR